MKNLSGIKLIPGGIHTDARGTVSFVNDFSPKAADRFYTIRSAEAGVPRGWIGHKIEHKWFMPLSGEWLIAAVKPDDWDVPSRKLSVDRYVLSSETPSVLHVPPGYACAMVMMTPDALLGIFSSGRPENVPQDDFRYPVDFWPISE